MFLLPLLLLHLLVLLASPALLADSSSRRKLLSSNQMINFCDPTDQHLTCGPLGKCVRRPHGARCQCAAGRMGRGCSRPCQDIYQSCDRWLQEGRCAWTRPFSAFFLDNCPLTCGMCHQTTAGQIDLPIPLPPILEPLAWLVGRWKTHNLVQSSVRFPSSLSNGSYSEILDIHQSSVPAFDRPPLNISIRAWSADGLEEHNELGFLTLKPAHEDTGFEEERGRTPHGRDMVALELVSSSGRMTIEEGELMAPGVLSLSVTWHREHPASRGGTDQNWIRLDSAKRSFRLLDTDTLEEQLDYTLEGESGTHQRMSKIFRRMFNYLDPSAVIKN